VALKPLTALPSIGTSVFAAITAAAVACGDDSTSSQLWDEGGSDGAGFAGGNGGSNRAGSSSGAGAGSESGSPRSMSGTIDASTQGSASVSSSRDSGAGSGSSTGGSSSGSASSSGSRSGSGSGFGSSSGSGSSGSGSGAGSGGGSGSGSSSGAGSGSGSSSGSSSGGSSGGPLCTWSAGPSSNNGEITCYWFGQGTATGFGCPSFKTYCGYCGSESGGGGGLCPSTITDSLQNIAGPYFAAFPSGSFGGGAYCGMCVEVTYNGKSVTATIVDECATCGSAGHIDLSLSTAVALGLGQANSTGDATNGVSWKAVDCPVSGDIVAVFNGSYAGQIYFQNVVFPVASASAGGHIGNLSGGYWDFGTSVAGQSVTLTDALGHTVQGTIPGSGGGIGAQFPATCQ
jgi:hypothetical protein